MALFPVSLENYEFEDSHLTFNLASGITAADVGKAVALDTSAPNQVKLAVDNDIIFGMLYLVENRVQEGILVGTIAQRFAKRLTLAAAQTPLVGSKLVGSATAGLPKVKATPAGWEKTTVVEVINNATVIAIHNI